MPAIIPPPPDDFRTMRERTPRLPGVPPLAGLLVALLFLVLAGVSYWWFVQRVEVPPGQVLVLIRKVGDALPAATSSPQPGAAVIGEQVVLYPALLKELGADPNSTQFKGIVYQPRTEGRHFYDPFLWERICVPAVQIKDDEIGILIRKYGRSLPPGKIVATADDERGPEEQVLKPGRYNVNPFAYEVRRVGPLRIELGQVGVQTLLSGREPVNPNDYVVSDGERGVQPVVLPPGMYYNNPYVRRIDPIDVRSHTIDMHGDDAIRFPSNDSFEITVDATVEYAIRQDMAPYVMVAIGTHDEIRDKLILPYARSLCRIEGSKLLALDFIGDTRTVFQQRVFEGLREQCYSQGIEVRATVIRRIVPPDEIAGPISDRQVADQQIMQFKNEIKLAESEAKLVEQQEMQKQNQVIGQANREVVTVTKEAEQHKAVALTEASQRLEVAKLNLQAASQTAAALLSRGRAEAEVMLLKYRAEAEPLRSAVTAFGGGDTYAQFFFYQKLAPALKSVLASTDVPFADVFKALTPGPAGKGTRGDDKPAGASPGGRP